MSGARVHRIRRTDPAYPPALEELADPPPAIYSTRPAEALRELLGGPLVAVVGPREPSTYGLEMARALGSGLAAAGVTVVSGLARGIDACALEAATTSGRALAVLPGPVTRPYPAGNARLAAAVARCGALISETNESRSITRWAFPRRNRIMAALAQAVVVVEARERSGTLITARIALELGRSVGAVPGRATSPLARGANALLRDGAFLVESPQDVLDELFGAGAARVHAIRERSAAGAPGESPASASGEHNERPTESPANATPPPLAALDAVDRAVLEAFADGDGVGAVAARCQLAPGAARAALGRLVTLGLLQPCGLQGFERTWRATALLTNHDPDANARCGADRGDVTQLDRDTSAR